MDWRDFIAMVLIVFLSLWGMLYLESDLAGYFLLELFIILLFIIIASGILYGLGSGKDWAWSAMTAFFAFALINTVIVFAATRNMTPFVLTVFVNLAGFAVCAARAVNLEVIPAENEEQIPDLPPMPVCHIDESDLIDPIDTDEVEDYPELEAFDYEHLVEKKEVKKVSRKKAAGKKKPSAGKKKRKKR